MPMIEEAQRVGGERNYFASHLCPEVSLFGSEDDSLPGLRGFPTTAGQYDALMHPPYQIFETGHFSECAEYSRSDRAPYANQRVLSGAKTQGGSPNTTGNPEDTAWFKRLNIAAAIATIIGTVITLTGLVIGSHLIH